MPEYKLIEKTIEVPKGTGVDGYLETVRNIISLPKVQEIFLQTSGRVLYRRYIRKEEPEDELKIDLSSLTPYGVIRNTSIVEVDISSDASAAISIARLFTQVAIEGLNPLAFACSPNSMFWPWHERTTGVALLRDEAYGLPILPDQHFEDLTLVLCAAYSRDAKLIDVKKAFKITIPDLTWESKTMGGTK